MKIIESPIESNPPIDPQIDPQSNQKAVDPPSNDEIEIGLRKGLIAKFQTPTAIDMMLAEQDIDSFEGDFPVEFYRSLVRRCCISWGGSSSPPDESKIRAADDEKTCLAFIALFKEAGKETSEIENYAQLIEDGGTRSGFDAVEVTLTSGQVLRFDEPSQVENRQREAIDGNIEGSLILASNLCRSIDHKDLSLADYRIFFNRLNLQDFFRISKALTEFFR
jgi:hypothetical protein